jgi:hypothetical protein
MQSMVYPAALAGVKHLFLFREEAGELGMPYFHHVLNLSLILMGLKPAPTQADKIHHIHSAIIPNDETSHLELRRRFP